MTRRTFVRDSGLAVFGIGAAPAWLARAAAASASKRKILVAIFQRGAADGLNMLVPHAEKRYYALRPSLAIARPGAAEGALDLDGFFGLHPAMAALQPLYAAKQLAVVAAAGSPDPTRSHFDAQDYMESGTPGRKSTRDGWLNRALAPEPKASPLRAVAMNPNLPRALRGANPAVAVASLREFEVRERESAPILEGMYARSGDAALNGSARNTFEAVRLLESMRRESYTPGNGAVYPNGRLGQSLQQVARLIKANVGVEVAFADTGGWDTHANQPLQLANLLRDFSGAIAAFHRDLGDGMEDVVAVTMSEFGRTARENGNRGTDHGHANAMFVIGAGVRGGRVHGRWPGLEPEQLYESRDLAVTTDFRDVLGELAVKHLGVRDVARVFPGHTAAAFPGVLG